MTDRGFNFVVLGFDPRFFICVFRVPCCDALLFRTYSPILPHGVMSGSVRLIRAGFPRDDMVGLAMVAIFELPPKKVYLCLNNFTVYVIHQKHDRLMDEVATYQCVSKIDPMLCMTRYGALRIMGVLHTEDPILTALDWISKLKARYRQLSLLVHPDKNPDHIQRPTECFKSINWVCVCVCVCMCTHVRVHACALTPPLPCIARHRTLPFFLRHTANCRGGSDRWCIRRRHRRRHHGAHRVTATIGSVTVTAKKMNRVATRTRTRTRTRVVTIRQPTTVTVMAAMWMDGWMEATAPCRTPVKSPAWIVCVACTCRR